MNLERPNNNLNSENNLDRRKFIKEVGITSLLFLSNKGLAQEKKEKSFDQEEKNEFSNNIEVLFSDEPLKPYKTGVLDLGEKGMAIYTMEKIAEKENKEDSSNEDNKEMMIGMYVFSAEEMNKFNRDEKVKGAVSRIKKISPFLKSEIIKVGKEVSIDKVNELENSDKVVITLPDEEGNNKYYLIDKEEDIDRINQLIKTTLEYIDNSQKLIDGFNREEFIIVKEVSLEEVKKQYNRNLSKEAVVLKNGFYAVKVNDRYFVLRLLDKN